MFDIKIPLLILAITAGTAVSADPGGFGAPRGEMRSFDELDSNGDGSLSQAELRAPALVRFTEADANGDGGLSADEMVAMIEDRRAGQAEAMFDRVFDRRDANEDGLIQFSELTAPREPRTPFQRLDADADGAISAEEYEQARERMADRRGGFGRGDRG